MIKFTYSQNKGLKKLLRFKGTKYFEDKAIDFMNNKFIPFLRNKKMSGHPLKSKTGRMKKGLVTKHQGSGSSIFLWVGNTSPSRERAMYFLNDPHSYTSDKRMPLPLDKSLNNSDFKKWMQSSWKERTDRALMFRDDGSILYGFKSGKGNYDWKFLLSYKSYYDKTNYKFRGFLNASYREKRKDLLTDVIKDFEREFGD